MDDEMQGTRLPEDHAGLGQNPGRVVAVGVCPGAGLRLPFPGSLVGLVVVGALESSEESRQLLQATLIQVLVLAAGIQSPGQLMTGLLDGPS